MFIDKEFYRPCEVEYLRVIVQKLLEMLGWKADYDLGELVKMMYDAKLQNVN